MKPETAAKAALFVCLSVSYVGSAGMLGAQNCDKNCGAGNQANISTRDCGSSNSSSDSDQGCKVVLCNDHHYSSTNFMACNYPSDDKFTDKCQGAWPDCFSS